MQHNQSRHGAAGYVDRPAATPRRKLGMPAKAKRWNHQDELDALKGKMIYIIPDASGVEPQRFTLIDADQFAIKVRNDQGAVAILQKHSFAGFRGA